MALSAFEMLLVGPPLQKRDSPPHTSQQLPRIEPQEKNPLGAPPTSFPCVDRIVQLQQEALDVEDGKGELSVLSPQRPEEGLLFSFLNYLCCKRQFALQKGELPRKLGTGLV